MNLSLIFESELQQFISMLEATNFWLYPFFVTLEKTYLYKLTVTLFDLSPADFPFIMFFFHLNFSPIFYNSFSKNFHNWNNFSVWVPKNLLFNDFTTFIYYHLMKSVALLRLPPSKLTPSRREGEQMWWWRGWDILKPKNALILSSRNGDSTTTVANFVILQGKNHLCSEPHFSPAVPFFVSIKAQLEGVKVLSFF